MEIERRDDVGKKIRYNPLNKHKLTRDEMDEVFLEGEEE